MSKLSYRPRALADLDFIYDIIAPDSPERAFAYVDDIRARCRETLLAHPLLGPSRPDLGDGVRIYPIGNKRVVVAYRVAGDEIVILRVFYGGADYAAIMHDGDD